jgi:hypothetical protein
VGAGGMQVGAGGATVASGGMTVTLGGLHVTDGLTVLDTGLIAEGGASVSTIHFPSSSYLKIKSGNVSITNTLSVYNQVVVKGTYSQTSDIRWKRDISAIADSVSKVKLLRGVYFTWSPDSPSGLRQDTSRHVGVIAQEVRDVLPEAVFAPPSDEPYLRVSYVKLIPLLLESIKELDSRIMRLNSTFLKISNAMRENNYPSKS